MPNFNTCVPADTGIQRSEGCELELDCLLYDWDKTYEEVKKCLGYRTSDPVAFNTAIGMRWGLGTSTLGPLTPVRLSAIELVGRKSFGPQWKPNLDAGWIVAQRDQGYKNVPTALYQVEPSPGPPGQPDRDQVNHATIVLPSSLYKVSDGKIQEIQGDNLARVEATSSHYNKKKQLEQGARINGGSKDQGAMEIGYDVKAALAACVLPADESRLKEVQSGTQTQSSVEKRGLTKAIVVNFICVIIYGQGFNKMDLESRTQCLMAVMDENKSCARTYACIKFVTVQHASNGARRHQGMP